MSSVTLGLLILASVFGGSMLGMALRSILPQHHRDGESRDLVKMGIGFVGTMAALLLGLLVASTKASYDAQKNELTDMSAKIAYLDRALVIYGPETRDAREKMRQATAQMILSVWPDDATAATKIVPPAAQGQDIYNALHALAPKTDAQKAVKDQAIAAATEIGKMRWHLFEQSTTSISKPLLVVVVSWLTIVFVGFGFCATRNATTVVTLFICALSVSSALFLILEMDRPFTGVIRIQDTPLRAAWEHMGKDG